MKQDHCCERNTKWFTLIVIIVSYQITRLIRETSQSDLDRSLLSSQKHVLVYFKYSTSESYNSLCTVRNCYVCTRH